MTFSILSRSRKINWTKTAEKPMIPLLSTRDNYPDLLSYRLLDKGMSQANVAFVQKESIFRQDHIYANPIQRKAQNERLLSQEYMR